MQIDSVLIVDDHELILAGFHDILTNKFSIREIVMLTDSETILSTVKSRTFDLYILDLELKDRLSGFDIIKIILGKDSAAKIIVCTMHEGIWYINRLLSSGVKGVLLKRSSLDSLETAVITVMKNGEYLCPRFQKLKKGSSTTNMQVLKNYELTPKEHAVLQYIVAGYTSKEIASFMFVTEDTIEAHRKNIFIKLGAKNVAELVAIAIRLNLVD